MSVDLDLFLNSKWQANPAVSLGILDISALFVVIVTGAIPLHYYHRMEDGQAAYDRDLVCKIRR